MKHRPRRGKRRVNEVRKAISEGRMGMMYWERNRRACHFFVAPTPNDPPELAMTEYILARNASIKALSGIIISIHKVYDEKAFGHPTEKKGGATQ